MVADIILRPTKDNGRPNSRDSNETLDRPLLQSKRVLENPPQGQPTRSSSGIAALDISTPRSNEDVVMQDISEDSRAAEENRPPKRAAVGDRISAGSGSPQWDSSPSSSPRRSKARPTSGQFESTSETENFQRNLLDTSDRPRIGKGRLWQEGQAGLTKSSFQDPSNIASIAAQKARAQQHCSKQKKRPFQPPPPPFQASPPATTQASVPKADEYEIVLQPETRPISQEQLVAEVKGIYTGLVMVEAKCIEVDNKQATLAEADPGAQPKLNNEQCQALIALHGTLLHEHHDFFLASQHPSASPALRRLASKYAMPARMWRHGIHSFLELLRHRLPASLDHMLAFIYLAYSMMALLYETVPAFEDTWIECLEDLGRYRMAIEDDDIMDREVWTGVARHWYSKASDKAPTTGRLYHHLAILARPNDLQQLFYYSKSLCVVIPFTSARESILTLFDPVLNAENHHQSHYRLPPIDTSFVKAHGLLFTNKYPERFEPTKKEFLDLLDSQIGRVTRKFMEQGYYTAVANCLALLGFADKDNILMKAISSDEVDMFASDCQTPDSLSSFQKAEMLANSTLDILLKGNGHRPNTRGFELFPIPRSGSLVSFFRRLQRYKNMLGASLILGYLRPVGASSTEPVQPAAPQFLRPATLATTLGACFLGMRAAKYYWNIDLLLTANIATPIACLCVASDDSFSNHELLILSLFGAGLDFAWVKDKILKYSRSAGVVALLLPIFGVLSASQLVDKTPGLQTRFDDQVFPIAILSLPTTVFFSLIWVAIERTGFAEDLENGQYNPHIFGFIKYVFDTFVLSMIEQLIRRATAYFLGPAVPGLGNQALRQPPHDIEADHPGNEPFRGRNPYQPAREERSMSEWSPDHY